LVWCRRCCLPAVSACAVNPALDGRAVCSLPCGIGAIPAIVTYALATVAVRHSAGLRHGITARRQRSRLRLPVTRGTVLRLIAMPDGIALRAVGGRALSLRALRFCLPAGSGRAGWTVGTDQHAPLVCLTLLPPFLVHARAGSAAVHLLSRTRATLPSLRRGMVPSCWERRRFTIAVRFAGRRVQQRRRPALRERHRRTAPV